MLYSSIHRMSSCETSDHESRESHLTPHEIATMWLISHTLTGTKRWELTSCCIGCGMDGTEGEVCECEVPELSDDIWEEAQHKLSVKRVKVDLTSRGQHSDDRRLRSSKVEIRSEGNKNVL